MTAPEPKDLRYEEALLVAEVLEGIASDLHVPPPDLGRRSLARYNERRAVLNSIHYRALAYRRRANTLREEAR